MLKMSKEEIPEHLLKYFKPAHTLKPGDDAGIPWRVAFALQSDGWILRQDIIWSKKSPMPESVRNRCTKAHEYIFLLVKKSGYYYDNFAIRERAVDVDAIKDYNLPHEENMYNMQEELDTEPIQPVEKGEIREGLSVQGVLSDLHQEVSQNQEGQGSDASSYDKVRQEQARKAETSRVPKDRGVNKQPEELEGIPKRSRGPKEVSQIRKKEDSVKKVLPKREGKRHNQPIPKDTKGERKFAAGDSQEAVNIAEHSQHTDKYGVGRDKKGAKLQVCDLQEEKDFDEGPHNPVEQRGPTCEREHASTLQKLQQSQRGQIGSRNKRSVWTIDDERALLDWMSENNPEMLQEFVEQSKNRLGVFRVSSESYSGSHFAVFPRKLITPCILAGTSEHGCCENCGKPWKRVVVDLGPEGGHQHNRKPGSPYALEKQSGLAEGGAGAKWKRETIGWEPGCECYGVEVIEEQPQEKKNNDGEPNVDDLIPKWEEQIKDWYMRWDKLWPVYQRLKTVPCIVLDPFCGSGTTMCVSLAYGRRSIGIDLSEKYLEKNAIPRIEGELMSRPALAGLAGKTIEAIELGDEI